MVKKTTPRCLHKNDSVKNKLIIRTAKEKCIKSLFLIAIFHVKSTIIIKSRNANTPKSAKFCTY